MIGPRRFGKTSILRAACEGLEEENIRPGADRKSGFEGAGPDAGNHANFADQPGTAEHSAPGIPAGGLGLAV